MSLPKFEELKKTQKGLPAFNELKPIVKNTTAEIDAQKPLAPQYGNSSKSKKIKPAPKPKLAQQLKDFRVKAPHGHALFYRYIRIPDPLNEGLAGPKGGACILVNMIDATAFYFTFTVCSKEDAFVKDEARRLCQERWSNALIYKIDKRDPSASCYENILRGIDNYFDPIASNNLVNEPKLTILSSKIQVRNLKLLASTIEKFYGMT